jgi:hypothetical protein
MVLELPWTFISGIPEIVIVPLVNAALVNTVELAPPLYVKFVFEPIVNVIVPEADEAKSAVIK